MCVVVEVGFVVVLDATWSFLSCFLGFFFFGTSEREKRELGEVKGD